MSGQEWPQCLFDVVLVRRGAQEVVDIGEVDLHAAAEGQVPTVHFDHLVHELGEAGVDVDLEVAHGFLERAFLSSEFLLDVVELLVGLALVAETLGDERGIPEGRADGILPLVHRDQKEDDVGDGVQGQEDADEANDHRRGGLCTLVSCLRFVRVNLRELLFGRARHFLTRPCLGCGEGSSELVVESVGQELGVHVVTTGDDHQTWLHEDSRAEALERSLEVELEDVVVGVRARGKQESGDLDFREQSSEGCFVHARDEVACTVSCGFCSIGDGTCSPFELFQNHFALLQMVVARKQQRQKVHKKRHFVNA